MVNWKSKKLGDLLLLANGLVLLILINVISSLFFTRWDLTEEKRYSIKPETKELLKNLEDNVYIEIYLEGELNAEFRRLQKAIKETAEEFRIYSRNKVQWSFTDPTKALSEKARNEYIQELASKGVKPTNVIANENGQKTEKLVFPGAVISYGSAETGVTLLKGNKAGTPAEEINQSIEGIEYELANAIYKLSTETHKRIGILTSHSNFNPLKIAAFTDAVAEVYDVVEGDATRAIQSLDALVILKPTQIFTEQEKFHLDQYIMKGGKVLWMIDKLDASMDSISRDDYFAFPYDLNLDDQLFKYGVRINMDLVLDKAAGLYPVITGQSGSKPKIQLMDWPYFPLLNHYADHPATRNLDAVVTKFVSSIDTVKALGVKKTPLIFTSQQSRTVTAPVMVNINQIRNGSQQEYSKSFIPVAYLLEGKFTSLYKNRFLPDGVDEKGFSGEGVETKMIVIADGDLALNDVNPRTQQPQELGKDPFTNYTFANKELLMNMIAYLADENGLIRTRNKEVKIRPLDKQRIVSEKTKWQIINIVMPLLILVLYGVIRMYLRKKRYASF